MALGLDLSRQEEEQIVHRLETVHFVFVGHVGSKVGRHQLAAGIRRVRLCFHAFRDFLDDVTQSLGHSECCFAFFYFLWICFRGLKGLEAYIRLRNLRSVSIRETKLLDALLSSGAIVDRFFFESMIPVTSWKSMWKISCPHSL